jgi:phage shock protein A
MDAFSRMESKVEALEAAAEVSAEMGNNLLPGTTSLEKQFKMLEAGNAVDDELAKLKGLLNPSSGGAPSSGSSSSSSAATDDEFEKLKRDAGL